MTAKEYLKQYQALDRKITAKSQHLEELEAKVLYVSPSTENAGSRNSLPRSRVEEITDNIMQLQKEINDKIDRLVNLEREIRRTIDKLADDKMCEVLEYHYINGMTLEQTAVKMNYSYPHVCRLHGYALAEIEKMIWNDS